MPEFFKNIFIKSLSSGVNIRAGVNLDPPVPSKEPLGTSPLAEVRPDPARNPSDVCLLPKTLGPCDGFEEAWYFDIDSRKCHAFKTGGPGNCFPSINVEFVET